MLKARVIGPDPVAGHGERCGEVLPPCGRGGWLTPVVSHLDRPAVSKFADGDVAVETPVAVVARPLDDHHVVSLDPSTDREREFGKVALHRSDEVGAQDDLTHLRPLPFHIGGEWHTEYVSEPGRAIR